VFARFVFKDASLGTEMGGRCMSTQDRTRPRAPDERFMAAALREAGKALTAHEVPVGAVVVRAGQIIGRGHNHTERRQDATQHAELIALRQAARALGSWRLLECELYVTLEPCAMCAGALVWSRVRRIVFGAFDPKAGACGSVLRVAGNPKLNHRPAVVSGVLQEPSARLLREFFQARRRK
jgi:tRNA(adenine34) deaminase